MSDPSNTVTLSEEDKAAGRELTKETGFVALCIAVMGKKYKSVQSLGPKCISTATIEERKCSYCTQLFKLTISRR